jgi:hypothetical protein
LVGAKRGRSPSVERKMPSNENAGHYEYVEVFSLEKSKKPDYTHGEK